MTINLTQSPVGRINLTLQAKTIEALRLLATLRGENLSQTAEALFSECSLIEKVEAALQKRKNPSLVVPPRNLAPAAGERLLHDQQEEAQSRESLEEDSNSLIDDDESVPW